MIKHTLLLSFFFLLIGNCCCDDDEKIVMPAETTTGEHTFGCYVNNYLFVHPKKNCVRQFGYLPLGTSYYIEDNSILIYSYDFQNRYIGMIDSIVEVGKTHKLYSASYTDEGGSLFLLTKDLDGEIYLSRFDPENGIVSGTFSFTARDESGKIVDVTNGRFDINDDWLSMKWKMNN